MTSFKAFLPHETRRFKLQQTEFSELERYLCEILKIQRPITSQYVITYFDDEQEGVVLSNNEELQDAISISSGNLVKIYLTKINEEPPSYADFSDSSSNLRPDSSDANSEYTQLPNHNQDNFELPPQLSFLYQYFQFQNNPNQSYSQNPTTDRAHPGSEGHFYQYPAGVNEIHNLLFFMITLSARLSSRMVGGRVSLNEEAARNLFDRIFHNAVFTIRNRITRPPQVRSPIKKIVKFLLVLFMIKSIGIPIAYSLLSTTSFFLNIFSSLFWFFFPVFALFLLMSILLVR